MTYIKRVESEHVFGRQAFLFPPYDHYVCSVMLPVHEHILQMEQEKITAS